MDDLKALRGSWYRERARFEPIDGSRDVFNPFDIPSEVIQDIIARHPRPFQVQLIDLSVAGQIEITTPGFHVVLFGHTNNATKTVNTTAFIECHFGDYKVGATGFPLKHNRGVSGPFEKLSLKWPAQPGVFADVVIYSGMFHQWVNGEAAT